MSNSLSIVLIPGFMLDDSLWDDLIIELPSEWHVFKANLLNGNTIPEIALSIAHNAPEKFILIGFSLGGYIARSLAEQFPDRLSALILIASSLRSDTPAQKDHKLTTIRLNSKVSFRGLSSISIIKSLHPSNIQNRVLVKKIQGMGKSLDYEAFVKQSLLNRDEYDMRKIKCPTLVVYGDQDQLRSAEEAAELHSQIIGSDLRVVQNTGHMIPMEQPQALAQIISAWAANKF